MVAKESMWRTKILRFNSLKHVSLSLKDLLLLAPFIKLRLKDDAKLVPNIEKVHILNQETIFLSMKYWLSSRENLWQTSPF